MRYAVREKLFSIGDDFWITDERGDKAFLVDGKVLRLRQTLEIQDPGGRVLVTVRKKLIAMHESMEIEEDGALAATVRKALVSPLHHRFTVELADGRELDVTGSITIEPKKIASPNNAAARPRYIGFRVQVYGGCATNAVGSPQGFLVVSRAWKIAAAKLDSPAPSATNSSPMNCSHPTVRSSGSMKWSASVISRSAPASSGG